jgi:quercetin dioxygenase-like cupin family protein
MKRKGLSSALFGFLALSLSAQTSPLISLSGEPHHHLVLHNEYVNAYQVEVRPHDATVLHRHDYDYLQIGIGNAQLVAVVPGQPDSKRRVVDGELQFGLRGSVHLSRNDSEADYRAVAVEFFQPQGQARNGCVAVIAGLPLNCPSAPVAAAKPGEFEQQLEFETDQIRVYRTRVFPHQNMEIANLPHEELLVALDDVPLTFAGGEEPEKLLHPGAFVWIDRGAVARLINNRSDQDVRLVVFVMKSLPGTKTSSVPETGASEVFTQR